MPDPITAFGLLALIFLVAALASGLVARAPISFPMIFLGLGFLLGDHGLGLIHIDLHDASLETIATLSLSFVLFLDALNLNFEQIKQDWLVPVLALGPGTLLTILLITLAAVLILHFPILPALLTGTVLASVDPVLLRDITHDERIPRAIRESLKTEAGANDMIVLPVLLVLSIIAVGQAETLTGWLVLLADLFLIGPLAGFAVGALAAFLMNQVRRRTPISREYRALYGIGVLLAAYFTGTQLGSSGFLAVFAAGLATAFFDDDLCDCFLDYGEITSEMLMLLAFLLFGVLLSNQLSSVALLPVVIFTLATLVIARPLAMGVVLRKARISQLARLFIGWFGPRGLSSLLFGLLLVSSRIPGAEQILTTAGVVVIISVILHGVSAAPLAARYNQAVTKQTLPEERESSLGGLYSPPSKEVPRITPEELASKLQSENPPTVLDVRSRSTYLVDMDKIPGSIRVLPDQLSIWVDGRAKDHEFITYCT